MTIIVPVLVGIYLLGALGIYNMSVNSLTQTDDETKAVFEEHPKLARVALVTYSAIWPVSLLGVVLFAAFRKVR